MYSNGGEYANGLFHGHGRRERKTDKTGPSCWDPLSEATGRNSTRRPDDVCEQRLNAQIPQTKTGRKRELVVHDAEEHLRFFGPDDDDLLFHPLQALFQEPLVLVTPRRGGSRGQCERPPSVRPGITMSFDTSSDVVNSAPPPPPPKSYESVPRKLTASRSSDSVPSRLWFVTDCGNVLLSEYQ